MYVYLLANSVAEMQAIFLWIMYDSHTLHIWFTYDSHMIQIINIIMYTVNTM